MWSQRPVAREALLCAAAGAAVAAILAWLGPPGTDLAAHAYQRALFIKHGFVLWDDDWRCLGGPTSLIEALQQEPQLDVRRVSIDRDATPSGHVAR